MCQSKECKCKCEKKVDLSKPLQLRMGDAKVYPARVLATDLKGDAGPVMVAYDYSGVEYDYNSVEFTYRMPEKALLGEPYCGCILENVPPKPMEFQRDVLVLQDSFGNIRHVSKEVGWKPQYHTVLARKTVTITEGEGL